MLNCFSIENLADIDNFIEKTNALHDGYIIAVEFHNNGIKINDLAYEFNSELTQLKIRVLITSIHDAVLEIIFDDIIKWKITDDQCDIIEATVSFDYRGFIVWSDGTVDMDNLEENNSYVIARKMKWRIL